MKIEAGIATSTNGRQALRLMKVIGRATALRQASSAPSGPRLPPAQSRSGRACVRAILAVPDPSPARMHNDVKPKIRKYRPWLIR